MLNKILLLFFRMPEYAFIRVCAQSQGGNEDDSSFSFRCSSGGIIRVLRVTLWRTNSNTICRNLTLNQLSRYTCPILSIAVRQECHQQNNCQYSLTYPDQNDCPEETYLPDRPIVLRMDFICVRCKYLYINPCKCQPHVYVPICIKHGTWIHFRRQILVRG